MTDEGGGPFRIRDYTLTSVATGLSARNVRELRERIGSVPASSILHHFWGRLLRSDADPGEYGNDLADWAARHLHDLVLAERLALVDPLRLDDAEALRERVAEILDERMEEMETHPPTETRPEDAFHFVSDQMVIYDTGPDVEHPDELPDVVEEVSDASLFLHFVARGGPDVPGEVDVPSWLRARGGAAWEDLADRLEGIDVFLLRSDELRARILEVLRSVAGREEP